MIFLCQSVLETRRISPLCGLALFIIPLRQPVLDHMGICVCDAVARVNQFLKILGKDWLKYLQIRVHFFKETLTRSFKMFILLKRLDINAFFFLKMHNSPAFLL